MEPACDRSRQLFVVAKSFIEEHKFLEEQENVKIAGIEIRAVGGMIKQIPAKFRQNSCCMSSVVQEEHSTCIKHSTRLVSNEASQFP
ncbi:hypothetical protein TNCV_1480931 [Trichonephila clavipes]|nr:hypothetical protein TNCV_1480931 [Trichonephila clavipes]